MQQHILVYKIAYYEIKYTDNIDFMVPSIMAVITIFMVYITKISRLRFIIQNRTQQNMIFIWHLIATFSQQYNYKFSDALIVCYGSRTTTRQVTYSKLQTIDISTNILLVRVLRLIEILNYKQIYNIMFTISISQPHFLNAKCK